MSNDERLDRLEAQTSALEVLVGQMMVGRLVEDLAKEHREGKGVDESIDASKKALNEMVDQGEKMIERQYSDHPRSHQIVDHLTRICSNVSATLEQVRGMKL
jgi:hypothetical protein